MEIRSLSNCSNLCSQVASWYFEQWFDSSSSIRRSDLENDITATVNRKSEIPHFYIMLNEEKLVGVVQLKFRENRLHPEYIHWLGGLYVHSVYRHQRVASKLIEHVMDQASKIGISELYLQCERNLVKFYENHGFTHLRSSKHGGVDTEIMIGSIDEKTRT